MMTIAGLADLKYYPLPSVMLEKIDQRSESLSHPIARYKYLLILPVGLIEIAAKLDFLNGYVKQITLQVPDLGTKTARLYLYDELGAEIFSTGALAESGTYPLVTSANPSNAYLAGVSTLKVTVSGAQATPTNLYAVIYLE